MFINRFKSETVRQAAAPCGPVEMKKCGKVRQNNAVKITSHNEGNVKKICKKYPVTNYRKYGKINNVEQRIRRRITTDFTPYFFALT